MCKRVGAFTHEGMKKPCMNRKRPMICVPSRVPAQSTPPHTSREMIRLELVAFGAVHSSPAIVVTFSFAVVEGFDALAEPPPTVAPPAARCARMRASNSMPPMIASACRRWQVLRVKCTVVCPSSSTNGGNALPSRRLVTSFSFSSYRDVWYENEYENHKCCAFSSSMGLFHPPSFRFMSWLFATAIDSSSMILVQVPQRRAIFVGQLAVP